MIHWTGITGGSYSSYDAAYGADGKLATIGYPDGRVATYGADGKQVSMAYSDGRLATYDRAADGSYVIHWTGITGGSYSSYDAAYGADGKLATIGYPDGRVATYGADGKQVSMAYSDGRVATYARNADGSYVIHWTGITGGSYSSYDAAYGVDGKLATIGYPDGRIATYGADGKQVSMAYSDGRLATYDRAADGSYVIHWTGITGQSYTSYDAAYGADGKLATIAYSDGRVATYGRNADGSYEMETRNIASPSWDTSQVFYGANGKVLSEVYSKAGVAVRIVNRATDGTVVETTSLSGSGTSAAPFGGRSSIDLRAFDTASTTLGFTEDASNTFGVLTLTKGNEQLALTLFGQYTASSFALASDGNGGVILARQAETPIIVG